MNGIISDDFKLLLSKNNSILEELTTNLYELKKNTQSLSSSFVKCNLNFFVDKLNLQTEQLENVVKKINGYHTTLTNVYKSYEEQSTEIVRSIKGNLMS